MQDDIHLLLDIQNIPVSYRIPPIKSGYGDTESKREGKDDEELQY